MEEERREDGRAQTIHHTKGEATETEHKLVNGSAKEMEMEEKAVTGEEETINYRGWKAMPFIIGDPKDESLLVQTHERNFFFFFPPRQL